MTKTEFVASIERLLVAELPPPSRGREWFLSWKPFLDALNNPALCIPDAFFHFLHHYVADADIRSKDTIYRQDQDQRLREHIANYRGAILVEQ